MKHCKTQARKWYATLAAFMLACALACAGMAFTQADEAWADATVTDWNGLQAAVVEGGTITLANDIVAEGTITISNEVTITGGKTIYSKAGRTSYDSMFKVANGGKLTIGEGVTLSGKTSTDGTSGTCPEPTTYTADKFTGSVSDDGKTYDPKGFFIQVERGGTATLNGTISDFVTSRNKADTPRYVAPVVADGENATFNIGSTGVIKNNLVGYIVNDNMANNDAQTIKQYVKGAGPNVPRVPNAATQKANRDNFDGRPRSNDAGIDGGAPGSGITATAGAVIYKGGAKGSVEGKIDNNRADTGGIMVSGEKTQVNIKSGTSITNNVGVQFGGGSTAEHGGSILMQGGTMQKNVAWFGGGAVYVTENGVDWLQGRMSGSDLLHPDFDGRKDGIFFMEGGELTENTAFTRGGAVLADSDGVNIQAGALSYNMSRMLGGAMYVMGDHPKYEYTVFMTKLYVHDNAAVSGEKVAREATTKQPTSDILANQWGDNGWESLNQPMQTLLQAPTNCGDLTEPILSGNVTGGKGGGNTDDYTDGVGAQGTGGGVWLCAYGNTVFEANEPDKVVITNNYATGAPKIGSGGYHKNLLPGDRADAENNSKPSTDSRSGITAGSDFHADTGGKGTVVINGLTEPNVNWVNENTGSKYESTVSNGRLNLVNKNTGAVPQEVAVEVVGNLARHGGGLAADGTFYFGTLSSRATPGATIEVDKEWANTAAKKPITIRATVNAKISTSEGEKDVEAILADVPLDGKANPPATEFDTVQELAPAGNTWRGEFGFPMSITAESGETIKLYTLVYTGADPITTSTGDQLVTDMELDPLSYKGSIALAAVLEAGKQNDIKVLFGEPTIESGKVKKNGDTYKVKPITISYTEMELNESTGELEPCDDYIFIPGEMDLSNLNYEISSVPKYKTTIDEHGNIAETTEVLYKIHLFSIPLTAPMSNDNWPLTEKYVNKDVHSNIVNFDQEFTYDIMAYVPLSATEFTISDTLVKGLEFADKDGKPTSDPLKAVQSIVMKMANNHKPGEEGTVSSDAVLRTNNGNAIDFIAWGPKYGDKYYPTMNIEGSTLSITFDHSKPTDDRVFGINNANEKWLLGRWIQVTFNARIKDEYRNLDALKELQAEVEGKTTSWEGADTNKQAPGAQDVSFANGDLGLVAALVSEVGSDPIDWAVEGPSRLFARSVRGEYYATPMSDNKQGQTWEHLEEGTSDWQNADNRYQGRPPEVNNTIRKLDPNDDNDKALLNALNSQPLVVGYTLIKGAEGGSRLFVQTEDANGGTHIFATPNNDKSGATWTEITEADDVYTNAIARLKPDNATIRMLDLTTGSFTLAGDGKNWPVISEEEHEGMVNQASYNVKFGNNAEGTYKTNNVTVVPETTELDIEKLWEGTDDKWPEDVKDVTFTVYSVKNDEQGNPVEKTVYVDGDGKYVGAFADGDTIPAGAEKLTIVLTKDDPATDKDESKATVKDLPLLKGTFYLARETKVDTKEVTYTDADKTTGKVNLEEGKDVEVTLSNKFANKKFDALITAAGKDKPIHGAETSDRLYAVTLDGEYWSTIDLEGKTGWTKLTAPESDEDESDAAKLYRKAVKIFAGNEAGVEPFSLKEIYTSLNKYITVKEEPEIEKYVAQAVHKEIDLEEEFTYDILAYVTGDADTVTITDVLDEQLQFVSVASDVTVVSHDDDNHKPRNDVAGNAIVKNADATVCATGDPVNGATITIDDNTLTVFIEDATALRSKWVQVTFKAKIADGLTLSDLKYTAIDPEEKEERAEPNKGNDPVKSTEAHAGVPNKTSYVIGVKNAAGKIEDKHKDESNTVTVKPKAQPTDVVLWVTKSMEDETGTSIAPEADAFTFQLKLTDPNGAVTMQRVSNSEEEGTRACFSVAGLDVPGEYKYEVTEVVGSDATIAYDTRLLEGSFCVAEFILPTKKTQPLTILGGLPVVLRSGLASQFAFAITPAKAEDTANGATFERILAVVDKATYDSYGGKAQKIDSRDDLNGVTLDAVEAGTFVNKKGGQQMLSAEASTVTKKWADGGNAKDRKPVDFQLYRKVGESGEWELVEGRTLTLTEEHSANTSEWTGRFDNLPAYENDELISYRVIEANSGDFSGLYTPGDDEEIVVVDMSSETGMSGTNHPNTPNTAIEIMVSKKAVGATAELKGAKLQVLDADGKVAVDGNGGRLEWTTTDKPHAIPMMPVGLYKLHEVSAPSGYDLAADIQFRVNVDGSVEVFDGKDWKAYDDKGIVMYDKPSTGKKPSTSKSTAKTGDTSGAATLSFALLAVLSAAALGATGRRAFGKK